MDACIPMEALGTLDELAPDDPMRHHVASCPRCAAAMIAYREFVRVDVPHHANVRDADARLAEFIAARIERADTHAVSSPRPRWFELRAWRVAAVAAAVAIVAVGVFNLLPKPEGSVVRGVVREDFVVNAPRMLGDGRVTLSWKAVTDADAYRVVFLGDDLSEVHRTAATTELHVTVARDVMGAAATRWQVAALREGAVLVESAPSALPR